MATTRNNLAFCLEVTFLSSQVPLDFHFSTRATGLLLPLALLLTPDIMSPTRPDRSSS